MRIVVAALSLLVVPSVAFAQTASPGGSNLIDQTRLVSQPAAAVLVNQGTPSIAATIPDEISAIRRQTNKRKRVANKRVDVSDLLTAANRKRELERQRQRLPSHPRFSIFGEFGWPVSTGDRRFPDFGQTLGRDRDWSASAGVSADFPLGPSREASNFWFSTAIMMFYLNTKISEIRNDGGGSGVLRGNDTLRGVAILAGFGGRPWPGDPWWSRWEWQLLGGIGYALNSLSAVNANGVAQFNGSERVTPLLARFALYYALTDNWKASLALTAITTPEITGRLPSGTQFQIGRATNLTLAIGLTYPFVPPVPPSGASFPKGVTTVTTSSR